jgi:DNA-binding NarL/FixJ family response regulator
MRAPASPLHDRLRVIRVLIVDDHDVIRTGLGRLVRSQPDLAVVGTAGDGLSAVRLALTGSPDVVVMDLAMPELDGVAATREILLQTPAARVLVLTGYADQPMARAAKGR